jgi:DNA modification methylase
MTKKDKEEQTGKPSGPLKGDFIAPPVEERDEREDALPAQEEFWRPPTRFGSVPVEKEPLGWDRRKGFRKLFPQVMLPFQVVERVQFGHPDLEPNRLFWGDNLHVMRQLPSESIDLIYIDPPFFSGQQYNVIFGDRNELRSFSDIWEGGMPGYLIWLNARLYEMKRLLKKTGSIFVHLDWHAVHYVKAEMDKIFGNECFQNEIIWLYRRWPTKSKCFQRMHDTILWYVKTSAGQDKFSLQYEPASARTLSDYEGKRLTTVQTESGTWVKRQTEGVSEGVPLRDVWEIKRVHTRGHERVGYPTQKPIELLQRIIESASKPGDVVADFFMGGGSFIEAAMGVRMYPNAKDIPTRHAEPSKARRWIGCDQSRIAVAITADRVTRAVARSLPSEGVRGDGCRAAGVAPDTGAGGNHDRVELLRHGRRLWL